MSRTSFLDNRVNLKVIFSLSIEQNSLLFKINHFSKFSKVLFYCLGITFEILSKTENLYFLKINFSYFIALNVMILETGNLQYMP